MKPSTISKVVAVVVTVLIAATFRTLTAEKKADILWDKYGVPHIFAAGSRSRCSTRTAGRRCRTRPTCCCACTASRAAGPRNIGGASNLELDRWVQLNGVPERAKAWYDAQDPTFRTYLDAFARGINDFAKAHPEAIDADYRVVLPVLGVDVVGHPLRAVHYGYMASRERMEREVNALEARRRAPRPNASMPGSR